MLFSLTFSLFIIASAVKLTLMFRPLYYFDIEYLDIVEQSNFSRNEIVENYNYVIDYLMSPKELEFKLPSIPYSEYGQIHFKDVKNIFTTVDILLIVTGLFSAVGIYLNLRHKNLDFLKRTSTMLTILPITLLIAFMINFDTFFVIFHKIFFRNDYWIFDPNLDPIINILPQEFFYHAALLIVILIISSIIVLKLLYKKFSKINHY
ncbi:TIGR01906 family membrane protein [Clostridium sp.]|uniref:TIGR01906 family membrane protein n=1 Tax=Clostridium sp. TaxID=1506 RepID=UPI0039F5E022